MIDRQHQILCIKEITGNITEKEKKVLNSWLADSNENKHEFEKLKNIWSVSKPGEYHNIIDLGMEWTKLNEKIGMHENSKTINESFVRKIFPVQNSFIPKLKPVLASILILFIIVIGIMILNRHEPEPKITAVSTTNKEIKNVQLPDGSTAYLNRGSSIEFLSQQKEAQKIFNNGERRVTLKGEAFFSVTKNKNPFIITTGNAKITVLGTKFDVLSRNGITRVVVEEGKVGFTPQKYNARSIYLLKNQLSIINRNSEPTEPQEINPGYFLGWMKGGLIFYQTPLNEIVDDLERYYNINITFKDKGLKNYTLTGSFKNDDADSALSMICLALGLDFEKQSGDYIIKTKKY